MAFLTSKEIIIVYIIAGLACFICFIVYLVERNNERIRKKHNTKELNKLVQEIRERLPETEEEVMYETPILETILEGTDNSKVATEPLIIAPIHVEETVEENTVVEPTPVVEEKVETPEIIATEELQYTSIEPDQETAKLQLKQLEEELEKQEDIEEVRNATLASFEEEQERTAIISMDELLSKGRQLYEANDIVQYEDEGNEPISLQDLERRVEKKAAVYEEPFIIENVVEEETVEEQASVAEEPQMVMHMDDFHTIQEATVMPVKQAPVERKFKSTPFISPIYGIEKDPSDQSLSLENTANYEKLDAEIRKSNEFVMSLQELQNKGD